LRDTLGMDFTVVTWV